MQATTAATQFNATDVREAVLFLTNDSAFYDSTRSLRENFAGHLLKGRFDADKARRILGTMVAAAQSSKSWREVYGTWKLAKADREQVAREVLEHYAEEVQELAADKAGPEFVEAWVRNFSHDVYGNPTAQHLVGSSTEEGGFVKNLTGKWEPRREQVGYGDHTDGLISAFKKAGLSLAHYTRTGHSGHRSEDLIKVQYKRNAFTVTL